MSDSTIIDPADALRLIRSQQRDMTDRMGAAVPATLIVWGAAFLVGFGALWLAGRDVVPMVPAVVVFGIAVLASAGVSTVLGVRAGRGLRSTPAADAVGTTYGVTWSVGTLAIGAIGGALAMHGLGGELQAIFFAVIYAFFIGVMFLAAGAVWSALPAAVLGGWTVAVAVAAAFVGFPHHFLVLALGLGLAFVGLGVAQAIRTRRSVG